MRVRTWLSQMSGIPLSLLTVWHSCCGWVVGSQEQTRKRKLARVAQESETGTCPRSSGPGQWDPTPGLTRSHLSLSRLGKGVVEHTVWSCQGWGCLGGPLAHVISKCLLSHVALAPCHPPLLFATLGGTACFTPLNHLVANPHCQRVWKSTHRKAA